LDKNRITFARRVLMKRISSPTGSPILDSRESLPLSGNRLKRCMHGMRRPVRAAPLRVVTYPSEIGVVFRLNYEKYPSVQKTSKTVLSLNGHCPLLFQFCSSSNVGYCNCIKERKEEINYRISRLFFFFF
jgi:hypothetical protein